MGATGGAGHLDCQSKTTDNGENEDEGDDDHQINYRYEIPIQKREVSWKSFYKKMDERH